MNNMRIKTHKINRGQYLNQIEPFKTKGIPSDALLFKELPGCGATRCEIEFPRHSIIVEPNVPVIKGKKKQFGKLVCGIFEGVKIDDILTYLENEVLHKKLIVTPESFWKVKEAIEESSFDMYQDFFLLFDECEKIIQDVSYRPDISLPMDDFFKFKQKAFVSATPILPSDPRFKLNHFRIHKIKPSFAYAQSLELITTNNVITTLKRYINDNPREKYFIFFNTTNTIDEVIHKLKLEGQSLIFCAEKSKRKLTLNGYKSNDVKTEIAPFKKYNFFTSRFFSAVDIDYEMFECNPTIIMVTDIVSAQHSMLDPFTEVIQIQGRFRKTQVNEFTTTLVHISNVDPDLTSMNINQVNEFIRECHIVYKAVHKYHDTATTPAAKEVLTQVLERIDYAKYLKPNTMERNFDMVDNLVFEEKVKGIYQSIDNLRKAYDDCLHFIVNDNVKNERYSFTDKDRQIANAKNVRIKSLHKIISERLCALHRRKRKGLVTDFEYGMEIANFQLDFPDQMAPINRYGLDNSEKVGFNIRHIEQLLLEEKKKVDHFGMMTYIQQNFQIGNSYTPAQINSKLRDGFKVNSIFFVKASVNYLRKYAELNDSKNRVFIGRKPDGKEIRGYKIIRFLDGSLN